MIIIIFEILQMSRKNQSLLAGLNQALLQKQKEIPLTQVYIEVDAMIRKVEVDVGDLCAGELISESVQKFNSQYNQNLTDVSGLYQIHGAKKNGKKKSDLPAIEHQQLITKTNLKRFHIALIQEANYPTKRKAQQISTQFQMAKKGQEIIDEKEQGKGFWTMFCIKWGFKKK